MKKIYFIRRVSITTAAFLLAFVAFTAGAQIVLTQASYATWALGLDSIRSISLITVAASNNATWDLSGGNYGLTIGSFTRTAVSGNATFPAATYSYPATFSFNPLLSYQATQMQGLGTTGVKGYGQVIARQAISLTSLTGGALDSLVFNQQNIVNSNPQNILAFPATAGTNWSSSYVWDLSISLTVAAYSLNNAPGLKRAYTTILDSVKGWGKMRVKNAAGQTTAYMDVLAVQTVLQQKDSFFLNGVPAPTPLVTAFGLSQGQISSQYHVRYYRAGEVQPLLTMVYPDNTFSAPSASSVHAARLVMPTASVPGVNSHNRFSTFPNPVSEGVLHIDIANAAGPNYSYEIVTTTGQTVSTGQLNATQGLASIRLDHPSGVYFLHVLNGGQSIGWQKIQILQ